MGARVGGRPLNKRQRKKNLKPFVRLLPRCKWRKRYLLDFKKYFRVVSAEDMLNGEIGDWYMHVPFTWRPPLPPLGERWSRGFKKKPRRLRYGG